jgi:hypothetical protein
MKKGSQMKMLYMILLGAVLGGLGVGLYFALRPSSSSPSAWTPPGGGTGIFTFVYSPPPAAPAAPSQYRYFITDTTMPSVSSFQYQAITETGDNLPPMVTSVDGFGYIDAAAINAAIAKGSTQFQLINATSHKTSDFIPYFSTTG